MTERLTAAQFRALHPTEASAEKARLDRSIAGKRATAAGKYFERELAGVHDGWERSLVARIRQLPVPTVPVRMAGRGFTGLRKLSERQDVDFIGVMGSAADRLGDKRLCMLQGRMIALEVKANTEHANRLKVVTPGKGYGGLRLHQLDALRDLHVFYAAIVAVLWKNEGRIGVLTGRQILHRYPDRTKPPASYAWADFEQIDRLDQWLLVAARGALS
jgi:hypothetical protein